MNIEICEKCDCCEIRNNVEPVCMHEGLSEEVCNVLECPKENKDKKCKWDCKHFGGIPFSCFYCTRGNPIGIVKEDIKDRYEPVNDSMGKKIEQAVHDEVITNAD